MNILAILFSAFLFYVLSPGILLSIPKNGSKTTVAAVHSLVFAIVYAFTHKIVWRLGEKSAFKLNY